MAKWLPIKNYEGFYEVSDTGLVRSVDRITRHNRKRKSHVLKMIADRDGYLRVHLSKDNVHKTFIVSRLVATTFIQNSDNKCQVNHINENKLDNRVCNLEWVNPKENINHGTRTTRANKKESHPVVSFHKSGFMRLFKSQTDASNRLNVSMGNLSSVLSGNRKQTKGYKFIG